MRKNNTTAFALLVLLLGPAAAKALDTADTLVCVTQDIHVCKLHSECREVHPVEMNAPDFWKIDLKEKTITGRRYDGTYGTVEIESLAKLPKLIVLQGVLEVTDSFQEGIGWTMAIHSETGRMSISASAHEEVVAILGTCHALE